jgi:hypothetical protein
MRYTAFLLAVIGILSACGRVDPGAAGNGDMDGSVVWVTAERLNRRTCPSSSCGVVGQFFLGEGTRVLSDSVGWARVSRYYDASCERGESPYVDSGDARCIRSNGIVDGRMAEWVSMQYLSEKRPPDPSEGAQGYHALVGGSDDFARYGDAFARAAQDLIASRRCSRADFEEMGGWLKSTLRHPDQPVYFTYCGGLTAADRIYLNAETGGIVR